MVDILLDLNLKLNEFCGKTDEELVVLAKSNRFAADALVLRYSRLIFIKAEIFSSHSSDSDDFCQEGLMGLLNAISSYNPERAAKFSTFAEVCIVNRMKSYATKIKLKSCNVISIDELPEDIASQEESPEIICVNKEMFSELWRIVDGNLSDLERQAFELYIRGETYSDISGIIGISEKSAANAIQRARGKIRKIFSSASLNNS